MWNGTASLSRKPAPIARDPVATFVAAVVAPALAAVLAVAVAGCGPVAGPDAASRPMQVAATVAPHGWLVERIAGDDLRVVTVLPATADPHSHTPTDAEVTRLARSRILFRAGVPFENGPWLRALTSRGVDLVDLRHGVELLDDEHGHAEDGHARDGHDGGHADHGADPHTWTSPRRLAAQAETVADALAELRPERAEGIRRRAREVASELTSLDAELTTRLAPHAGRRFYVHHPSWSYLASDYGLEQVALEAGGSEPSDAQLTRWLDRARADGARVVFTQPQSADSAPRIVAASLGARVESLDPLAADVPAQLRITAERLLASWSEP